jgi:hypothetical protein
MAGFNGGEHVQGGGELQLPGRGQMSGRGRPQLGQALLAAQSVVAQPGSALVEEHRVDALHPGGVLAPQVVIGLQQRPVLQDVFGRDPAFGQPSLGQQRPQVPGIGLVGLGVPFPAAGGGGIGRLAQMRGDPGGGQLLADIPPPRAPLHRERHLTTASKPGQPGAQVLPVGRGDLATPHLPGHGVEIVESDLLPVDIQPAYDGHRDLLTLPRAPQAPVREFGYAANRDASELGRSLLANSHRARSDAYADPPMHVI